MAASDFLGNYVPASFVARVESGEVLLDYVLALDNSKKLWLMKTRINDVGGGKTVELVDKYMVHTQQSLEEKIYFAHLYNSAEGSYDIYFCTTVKVNRKCTLKE